MNKVFKNYFLLCVALLFFAYSSCGQTEKRNLAGAHVAYGGGIYGAFFAVGAPSYDTKYYCSVGVDYARKLSKRWDLYTGLEYTYVSLMVEPNLPPDADYDNTPHKESFVLGTVPVQFKLHLGQFFFLNGGAFFNILGRTSENWGVKSRDGEYRSTYNLGMLFGCGVGVGLEYEFNSGIVCSINPYIRANGIGGIGSFVYFTQLTSHAFLQSGVSFGVGYKF